MLAISWRRFLLAAAVATLGSAGAWAAEGTPRSTFILPDPDPDPIPDPPPPCPTRVGSDLDISQILKTPVTVERRLSGQTALIVFELQPNHAFNPDDPNGCTGGDGVPVLDRSINVASWRDLTDPFFQGSQRVIEVTPRNPSLGMEVCFKVKFQENFNVTQTLKPRKKKRALVIPFNKLANGQVITVAPTTCSP